jgi:6-phosphogluconolactonase (cycloisomerase 2 family)
MADRFVGDHFQDLIAIHLLDHGLEGDNASGYVEIDDAGRFAVQVAYGQGTVSKQEVKAGGCGLLKDALLAMAFIYA